MCQVLKIPFEIVVFSMSLIPCFFLSAGVLSVCVELPWLNLEKLGVEKLLSLMGGGRKSQPEKSKIAGEEAGKSN